MKLASLKSDRRDGTLVVINHELTHAVAVPEIAPTLQAALDNWAVAALRLETIYRELNRGAQAAAFTLDLDALAAPLPRAYQWLDGSAYLSHVERARRARGSDMLPEFQTDPLMYQGVSDNFLAARDPILAESEDWGIDFEAEVAIITDEVPLGTNSQAAASHIKLLMLVNDVSLRKLIAKELPKGFGFIHGKPPSSCSPVACTPEELTDAWDGAKVHLPLISHVNGKLFGQPEAGRDMQFDFPTLISHAAKTRRLGTGTIVGSGTVSNADASRGFSCIVEKRMDEVVKQGSALTPFLRFGDRVRIEMLDKNGRSIFGAIEQSVEVYNRPE